MSTPKETAEELAYKMYQELPYHYDVHNQAKQCALIAVDNVIHGSRLFYLEDYEYWNQVKTEIEKL